MKRKGKIKAIKLMSERKKKQERKEDNEKKLKFRKLFRLRKGVKNNLLLEKIKEIDWKEKESKKESND